MITTTTEPCLLRLRLRNSMRPALMCVVIAVVAFWPTGLISSDSRKTIAVKVVIDGKGVTFADAAKAEAQLKQELLSKNVKLVDRSDTNMLLKELEFIQSGVVQTDKAAQAGKLLGVDIFLIGRMFAHSDGLTMEVKSVATETARILTTSEVHYLKNLKSWSLYNMLQEVSLLTSGDFVVHLKIRKLVPCRAKLNMAGGRVVHEDGGFWPEKSIFHDFDIAAERENIECEITCADHEPLFWKPRIQKGLLNKEVVALTATGIQVKLEIPIHRPRSYKQITEEQYFKFRQWYGDIGSIDFHKNFKFTVDRKTYRIRNDDILVPIQPGERTLRISSDSYDVDPDKIDVVIEKGEVKIVEIQVTPREQTILELVGK